MKTSIRFAAIAFAAGLCFCQSKPVVYQVQEVKDIVYGKGQVEKPAPGLKDLLMDAWLPVGSQAEDKTAIIMVHGGGWHTGDKGTKQFAFTGNHFAAKGYCVFSINYRLMGDLDLSAAENKTDRSVLTAGKAIADVKTAVRWVRAKAGSLGIAKDRVVLMGGSAGAYNSTVCALTDNDFLTVDVAGTAIAAYNHPAEKSKPDAVVELYGFFVPWMPRYVDQMDTDDTPILIVQGGADKLIKLENAEIFRDHCVETGVPHTYKVVPDGGHGMWHSPTVRDSMHVWTQQFLASHLK